MPEFIQSSSRAVRKGPFLPLPEGRSTDLPTLTQAIQARETSVSRATSEQWDF